MFARQPNVKLARPNCGVSTQNIKGVLQQQSRVFVMLTASAERLYRNIGGTGTMDMVRDKPPRYQHTLSS